MDFRTKHIQHILMNLFYSGTILLRIFCEDDVMDRYKRYRIIAGIFFVLFSFKDTALSLAMGHSFVLALGAGIIQIPSWMIVAIACFIGKPKLSLIGIGLAFVFSGTGLVKNIINAVPLFHEKQMTVYPEMICELACYVLCFIACFKLSKAKPICFFASVLYTAFVICTQIRFGQQYETLINKHYYIVYWIGAVIIMFIACNAFGAWLKSKNEE